TDVLNNLVYGIRIDVENVKRNNNSLSMNQKENLENELKEILPSRFYGTRSNYDENMSQTYEGDSECSDCFEDDSSSFNTEDEMRSNYDENMSQTYDGDSEFSEGDDYFENDSSSYITEDEMRSNFDETTNQIFYGNDECSPTEEMRSNADGNVGDTNQTYDGNDEVNSFDFMNYFPYQVENIHNDALPYMLFHGDLFELTPHSHNASPQQEINSPQYFI
ncbi:13054_t:CDS:1, partial [Funneliformis mosseae]